MTFSQVRSARENWLKSKVEGIQQYAQYMTVLDTCDILNRLVAEEKNPLSSPE
jgi:hypothetical protein